MRTTYDYVIVGGGTAGLVLANRLSSRPSTTVLVLEAGGSHDEDPKVAVPGLWATNAGTNHDWVFTTEPQKYLGGRSVYHMQGKLLGGTSSINAQVLMPPSAADLDAWAELGNTSWGWETMKPFLQGFYSIKEPEDATLQRLDLGWSKNSWMSEGNPGGPVKASFTHVKEEDPLADAWVRTISNLGYPLKQNPFDGTSTGAFNGASTVDATTKKRVSSSTAYLHPAKERKNLEVKTGFFVQKIELEKGDNEEYKATGVEYIQGTERHAVAAQREVLLCAGAFQSPKLLELSGIGDPKILNRHGIDVKVANPYVGTNLQDHLMHSLSFEVQSPGGLSTRDNLLRADPTALTAAMSAYNANKLGPLCSSAVTSFAYLPIDDFTSANDNNTNTNNDRTTFLTRLSTSPIPHPHPLDPHRASLLHKLITTQTGGTAQYFPWLAQSPLSTTNLPTQPPKNFITILASLAHPLSTGTVHISSADPAAKPTIDPAYLSHPLDQEMQARHLRFAERIAMTPPFCSLLKDPATRPQQEQQQQQQQDEEAAGDARNSSKKDDDLAQRLEQAPASTHGHPCGTCAMAPREKGGVVDEACRVYGARGLRVVDAAVFPLVPQSNLVSLVYGVGERVAGMMMQEGRGREKGVGVGR